MQREHISSQNSKGYLILSINFSTFYTGLSIWQ